MSAVVEEKVLTPEEWAAEIWRVRRKVMVSSNPEDYIAEYACVIHKALEAEREACARVAEEKYPGPGAGWHDFYTMAGRNIAAAIRARSKG